VLKIAAAVLAFLCLMLFSAPMSAQLIPHGNVYVGAAWSESRVVITRYSFKGWNASAEAIPLSRFSFLGLAVDGSGFYRPGITEYNILAGPRVAVSYGKWRPFVHGLAGIQRVNSSGNYYRPVAFDFGGGLDYKLPFRNFSWRVQADYMHTHYSSAYQNHVRASTGIVWRF
jgi:hypothetical protein